MGQLDSKKCLLMLMPKQADDKSFVMTSSFSCMFLSVLKIFNLDQENYFRLDSLIIAANYILRNKLDAIKKLDQLPCSRIIFLVSAAFKGISQEASLKSWELTQGEITTHFNSILGFQHGPKAVINNSTIIFIQCSTNPYTRKYELDLINELVGEEKSRAIVVMDGKNDATISKKVNHYFSMGQIDLNDKELALLYLLVGQIYAFYKSINLNFSPDNPCPNGEVNRVVKGVTIYKL